MKKTVMLFSICLSFLIRLNAAGWSQYLDTNGPATKVRKVTAEFSSQEAAIDRSLHLRVQTLLNEKVASVQEKLNWLKSLNIGEELYGDINEEFLFLCEKFNTLQAEVESLMTQDGYLAPLSEPNKETIHALKTMCGKVDKTLNEIAFQIDMFEVSLNNIIAVATEK